MYLPRYDDQGEETNEKPHAFNDGKTKERHSLRRSFVLLRE